METNQVNVPPQARNPNWWPNRWNDRIKFEWPWLRAAVFLALVYALAMQAWPSSIIWGLISAFCAGLCGLAMGLRPERKSLAIIPAVLGVAAAAGLLLPAFVVQAIWSSIAVLLGVLVLGLRYFFPYRAQRVRMGDKYSIGKGQYELSNIEIRTPRIYYVRAGLLEQLMELAAYADEFLGRHGMQYVLCYGSMLGAVRHKGPMPWDDDVDFTIYRPQDIRKLEDSFAELAAAASRDGYCLFSHNDYWKLSRKGFWRYPVVDLYRAAIYQPIDTVPQRKAWGSLMLSVPDNAVDRVVEYYGKASLTEAVFDIPYWDSGFVPAAAVRLFGIGFTNRAGEVYQRLFGKS